MPDIGSKLFAWWMLLSKPKVLLGYDAKGKPQSTWICNETIQTAQWTTSAYWFAFCRGSSLWKNVICNFGASGWILVFRNASIYGEPHHVRDFFRDSRIDCSLGCLSNCIQTESYWAYAESYVRLHISITRHQSLDLDSDESSINNARYDKKWFGWTEFGEVLELQSVCNVCCRSYFAKGFGYQGYSCSAEDKRRWHLQGRSLVLQQRRNMAWCKVQAVRDESS